MKKLLVILISCCALSLVSSAQSLQFSTVLLVDNNQQTVPAGKVWKVTSISGGARNFCIDIPSSPYYARANGLGFYVNGTLMGKMTSTSSTHYTDPACSASGCCAGSFGTIGENGDMVPMWLPAGTTLEAVAPEILLSVIEFTVVP
jgi:hypothetical protein